MVVSLIDTHCHVHESEFSEKFGGKTPDEIFDDAKNEGVSQFVCVGTSLAGSKEAVTVSTKRIDCFASIALHPHEGALKTTQQLEQEFEELAEVGRKAMQEKTAKLIAVGECGLDYYYHESKTVRDTQKELFKKHIELANELGLPMIFHIRDAFDDFFQLLDEYPNIRGVVHSFSAGTTELDGIISRGLYVGLNGIMTFTKDESQLTAARNVPLQHLLLETDAPFLTPKPFRGIMCQPKHIRVTAEFLSELRGESLTQLATETTKNAQALFGL